MGGVRPIRRYDGTVEVLGEAEAVVATWTFTRGLPAKLVGPQLNAKTGEVAIEELHIAHEGLRLGGCMTLQKATLQEIDAQAVAAPQADRARPIKVQVNPTSLRLALTNNTDVGKAVGRPNTTFQGSSSSTLTFDLMMDTADQGTTGNPSTSRP